MNRLSVSKMLCGIRHCANLAIFRGKQMLGHFTNTGSSSFFFRIHSTIWSVVNVPILLTCFGAYSCICMRNMRKVKVRELIGIDTSSRLLV